MTSFNAVLPQPFQQCSICLEDAKKNVVTHDGKHFFHKKCLKPWVSEHFSCPICKVAIMKPLSFRACKWIEDTFSLDRLIPIGGVALAGVILMQLKVLIL